MKFFFDRARLNSLMYGWVNYFKYATGYERFDRLDGWIRNRLRCGWRLSCSPVMGMAVTVERLKQRGYRSFKDYYHHVRPKMSAP